jgi:chemotaxis protein methyltransferase CheR
MSFPQIEPGHANVTDAEFTQISDMVYKHCGINLHEGKKELVQARIARQMRTGGFKTAGQYIDSVLSDSSGDKFSDLIDALSTNLTSFFRENQHFQHLTDKFLPKLIENRNREGKRYIRAWSAGCSSGEEPYTLAIVISEALGSHRFDVKILATDISRRVLSAARRGVYDEERVETVPSPLRHKYFAAGSNPGTVKIVPDLQRMIRFNYLNLQESWPFSGPFDFIFCRNVMIYFDKPTQQKLVNRYHDCLAPGGLLFTGHSESLTGVKHPFKYVLPTIYSRS